VPPPRPLVLASASPRRLELLRRLGLSVTVLPAAVDEHPRPGEAPGELAGRLARAKALAVTPLREAALVIGADTIVVLDGLVLGKPRDRSDAAAMLARLAGRTHEVITAFALRAFPEETLFCERSTSRVTFAPMSPEEIDWYAGSGEGDDKAGAYAVQGLGSIFVTGLEGSYTNVIGLPLDRLYPHLKRLGYLPPASKKRPATS
jgi:nucleoside triphosphate pyrophosphatase